MFCVLTLMTVCCLCLTNGNPFVRDDIPPPVQDDIHPPVQDDIHPPESFPTIYDINMKYSPFLRTQRSGHNCEGTKLCHDQCRSTGFKRDANNCEICECAETALFEVDILVDHKTIDSIDEQYGFDCDKDKKNKAGTAPGQREWPKTGDSVLVPYVFDNTLDPKQRTNIQTAMKTYKEKTCIEFIKRTNQKDYLNIIKGQGCYSYVGRTGGAQDVSIGQNCDNTQGTIIHELMHALGFWHEQSRPDRDEHVKIRTENVKKGTERNFQKQVNSDYYESNYDVGSVMHYGSYAFSKNGKPTIVRRNTGQTFMTQRRTFGEQDLVQIRNKYCKGTTSTTTASTTAAQDCVDRHESCSHWNTQGYCTGIYEKFMKEYCARTCNECSSSTTTSTAAKVCVDLKTSCSYWNTQGYCTGIYEKFMKENCAHTCKSCS